MIFNPENSALKDGCFVPAKKTRATAHGAINKEVLKDFWLGHTCRMSELEIDETDELIFMIGTAEKLPLDGNLYAINVSESGVCITASDEKSLVWGFITMLDRIVCEGDYIKINCCEIKDKPLIENRMVHFCVFPDTELWEVEKFVRLCGALKYSHLVLEFWGMIKYDCLKELSWEHAFTKEQIAPIIREANDLGIEIVPMFNHWGHASASRAMHGKHVVLDKNPALWRLFSEDGWCWNIGSPEVKKLLGKIRGELSELCGEGKYFHAGCDEAYNFDFSKENADMICDYINEIEKQMSELGRRTIIWGDMFLFRRKEFNPENIYSANSPSLEIEKRMLDRLNKNVIMADWQYNAKQYPLETSIILKEAGFDIVTCPWDEGFNESDACIKTAKEHGLYGILHTTWHTLSKGTPHVVRNAVACWEDVGFKGNKLKEVEIEFASYSVKTAAVLRKVWFADGDYKKAGWAKHEIGVCT